METILTLGGVALVGFIFFMMIMKNMIYVCAPNQILIIAGGKKRVSGRNNTIGYKLITKGKVIRKPIIEDIYRMDISNIPIEIRITKAFSKGGVPLNVQAVANVKVESSEPLVHNAIERFLGKSKNQIAQIAQETLEGNLRGVLASLTPEELNDDKIAFTKKLLEEADEDLAKLGLTLDNLQIQQISDNVGYLDSIGRRQTAFIQRDARIKEAKDKSSSLVQEAVNDRKTKIIELDNRILILKQDSTQMLNDALSRRKAVVAEANARVVKEIARTKGAIKVSMANIDKVKHKLTAEIIKPAEAKRDRLIEEAKANSAKIIADANANADALQKVIGAWKSAGKNGKNIFIMEKIDPILDTIVGAIKDIKIDKVTVIDSKLTSGEDGNPMVKAISALEQLKETTGIDVASTIRNLQSKRKL